VSDLSSEQFAECLNSQFQVDAATGGGVALELVRVTKVDYSPRLDNFSLIFRGPRSPFVPQGSYSVNHRKLGEMTIFLVPIGADGAGTQYEAVFNRVRDGVK
jgi:hypothetical protein